ncbi:glycosyltransferase [Gordonia tangerina]|uniref:Glycosyltransferase n=1 Tax=Gordonia tangerina TaxID=2911060 RepID=A0ABS9DN57_9ACTN|nr:glycosyltransferase [Gordonia tangerina]MCF3939719.1 glycosyltransferase [Gordonia tangerina]
MSVVIPARNARNLIDRQLEALATQDYPAGFEVLICDNGSRDGLRRHIETHRLREKLQMKWLDASERAGTSFARNVGSRAAAGDLIVYCDADDMVHPQWLRHMVETAGFHNVVSGGVETTSLNAPEVASWRPMPDAEEPFEFPGFMNVVSGCNMACWRDDFMAVGGFDETYVSGYEDADFALRVQLRGGTVGHAPEALVGYRLRETLRGTFSQSAQYGLGNVQLYADYRDYGMPRRPVIALLDVLLYLTLRNPLLPEVVTRVPAGRWLFQAGHLLGRIKGSVRYGCFYV